MIPPVEQDALPSPWQQHMDQRYNYYNPETAEMTWERPKAKPETVSMRTRPPMPLPPNSPSSTNSIDRQSVQPDSDIPSNKPPPSQGKMPHTRDTSSKAPPCQGDTPSFPPKSDTFPPAVISM